MAEAHAVSLNMQTAANVYVSKLPLSSHELPPVALPKYRMLPPLPSRQLISQVHRVPGYMRDEPVILRDVADDIHHTRIEGENKRDCGLHLGSAGLVNILHDRALQH